jgi:hypothetical protein
MSRLLVVGCDNVPALADDIVTTCAACDAPIVRWRRRIRNVVWLCKSCAAAATAGAGASERRLMLAARRARTAPTAREIHLINVYAALGIEWGGDPFAAIMAIRAEVDAEQDRYRALRDAVIQWADRADFIGPAGCINDAAVLRLATAHATLAQYCTCEAVRQTIADAMAGPPRDPVGRSS